MSEYYVVGLPDEITEAVRRTMRSPEYGHPVVREIATGTGPCRACLEPFRVGEDQRLLFTYRPPGGTRTLGTPGPVFIHAEPCVQFRGNVFPAALRSFELIIEARGSDHRIPEAHRVTGAAVDSILKQLLANPEIEYVNVRHGTAGCHITRVDRGSLPAVSV